MPDPKKLRPLSSYLEFGMRLYREDFAQLTLGSILVYVPLSWLLLSFHPSMETIVKNPEGLLPLLPKMLLLQLGLRVIQTFVVIMIVLRIDARRISEEDVWDFSAAFDSLGRVVLVDLVYVFGLHFLGIMVFWGAMNLGAIFLGGGIPLFFPVIIALTVVVGPFVRYYFASFVSLFRATSLTESFRDSAALSAGSERLVLSLVMTFIGVWLVVLFLVQVVFGVGYLGQIAVQAGVMAASIPYYIVSYLLYLDLAPPETDDRSPAGSGQIPGVIDPFGPQPGPENPGEDHPPER